MEIKVEIANESVEITLVQNGKSGYNVTNQNIYWIWYVANSTVIY